MKKVFIFLSLLLIIGCGKKENNLKCEISNNLDYGSSTQTVEFYGEDKISKMIVTESFVIDDSFSDFYDALFDSVFNSYNTDVNGIKVESKKDGLSFKVIMTVNINELDSDMLENSYYDFSKSLSEFKEEFINDGYTCN